MKKDALEHNDRGAIASPTALSMQQKAQAAEAHHMDEEVCVCVCVCVRVCV